MKAAAGAACRGAAGRRHSTPLVVVGEQDPDFPDPRVEADWIGRALRGQVVMVSEAGRYPQSQRPDLTAAAILRFLETVKGRAQGRAHPGQRSWRRRGGSSAR
jgi:pimeloyl-ACP methyl ester carboxylesterase